ncbi:MAG TPA: bifunctional DNA-formamidopyrimidine glycosylase/DNA-(apurinic or apyrimidinic site) lyase [Candidatus Bathyarchaeia archaeon]|nr:bifunctional DNA-formamidopyrimidine glycosylase/DNA-(apurinic or apyrimidinic site) lyase [Candidatus Bathyarchaeia archaeon]
MPELPEVETIRLQLNQVLKGLKIVGVEVLSSKNFIGSVNDIVGEKISSVERRAKIILIKLSHNRCLAIHLKMTGQLIFRDMGLKEDAIGDQNNGPFAVREMPNKYTRVIVEFTSGAKLYFNDLRKFGWMKVIGIRDGKSGIKDKYANLSELANLGPEAIDEKTFSLEYLKKIFSKTKKAIKLILLDQGKIAGIGNIYANEALFLAGIKPEKLANQLNEKEIEKLRNSVIKILKEAIKHQGTSDKDEAYRQTTGEKGSHQNYLQVYGREGKKCRQCGKEIKRIKIGGRGTFYCPNCQK